MNKESIEVLSSLIKETESLKIEFMLIGAFAMECFVEEAADIVLPRKTLDVDVACQVNSWDDYKHLFDTLVKNGIFKHDSKMSHRLRLTDGDGILDILPFGGIEDDHGNITWPPEFDETMSMKGFSMAYDSATNFTLDGIKLRVINPAAFALLKLKSWGEDNSRTKDLRDFYFIAFNYFDLIDADARIYNEGAPDSDLRDSDDFDFICAGAELIGRDASRINKSLSQQLIAEIINTGNNHRLYNAMGTANNIKYTMAERILTSFAKGISN